MKKVRVTESQLIDLIREMVQENNINENPIRGLVNRFMKPSTKATVNMGRPASLSISQDIRTLIKQLPQSIKVGQKLNNLFKTHSTSLKSLEGSISRSLSKNPKFGIADTYAKSLVGLTSTPLGQSVDLKKLLSNAQNLKINLDEIIKSIPKPTGGSSAQLKKSTEDWYNYLYTEKASLNKFIDDLMAILPKK